MKISSLDFLTLIDDNVQNIVTSHKYTKLVIVTCFFFFFFLIYQSYPP